MMTRGEFVGQHGVSAEIDGRLLIEYDGPCLEIEGFLRDVRRRSRIDADRPAAADVLQRLVIELSRKCPVQEARLCDVPGS
jgi:hypothetical protein